MIRRLVQSTRKGWEFSTYIRSAALLTCSGTVTAAIDAGTTMRLCVAQSRSVGEEYVAQQEACVEDISLEMVLYGLIVR